MCSRNLVCTMCEQWFIFNAKSHIFEKLYGEISIRPNLFIRWNFPTAKFLWGKIFYGENKIPYGEISLRWIFYTVKLPYGEISYAKLPAVNFPTAKFLVTFSGISAAIVEMQFVWKQIYCAAVTRCGFKCTFGFHPLYFSHAA